MPHPLSRGCTGKAVRIALVFVAPKVEMRMPCRRSARGASGSDCIAATPSTLPGPTATGTTTTTIVDWCRYAFFCRLFTSTPIPRSVCTTTMQNACERNAPD